MSEHEQTPALGKTADGIPIVEGLAVITNEIKAGFVRTDHVRPWSEGWFDVEYPARGDYPARRVLQNGERVATRFGGLSAAEELKGI